VKKKEKKSETTHQFYIFN